MNIEALLDAGLTLNEAKIYLCLVKNPDLPVGKITDKTNIHRRNVYDALNRLVEKGLVNEITISNKKRFNASNPGCLLEFMQQRTENIAQIIPSLTKMFDISSRKSSVKMYKGIGGVKASFSDSFDLLEDGETYYCIGAINLPKSLNSFMEWNFKERIRRKIQTKAIFNFNAKARAARLSKMENFHIRVLPQGFHIPVQTTIYGDKCVCLILKKDNPFVVQINDSRFAKSYQKHFKLFWDISEEVK